MVAPTCSDQGQVLSRHASARTRASLLIDSLETSMSTSAVPVYILYIACCLVAPPRVLFFKVSHRKDQGYVGHGR